MELYRTFICLELSESLKLRLQTLEQSLKSASQDRVSWVKPINIHLTLRFLGDIERDRQPQLRAAVEKAVSEFKPFTLIAAGTGVFPNPRNPRVFWVGIKNAAEQLLPLQKRVQQQLETAGFGREDKPFSPHITIGRVRQGNAADTAAALKQLDFIDEPFAVDEVIVMRSELLPAGPKYTRLATLKLA